jgi:hypothetical protein
MFPFLYEELDALDALKSEAKKAKLTIARQIASIVLAVWQTGEVYDPKKLEGAARSDGPGTK